ncbi:MAG: aminotransferase class IV [Nocardioides sp.]|nr:aminotransferase class IV [Nocardioides sp.]
MTRRPDPSVGVFTTLLAEDGRAIALPAHVARLAASVRELYGVTLDEDALDGHVLAAAGSTDGLLRLRVSYRPAEAPDPIEVTATPLPERPRGPWHLVVRRVPGGWGAHKWLDRDLLASWTDPADPDLDPLLVDEHDQVLETGRGNVFVVGEGRAATPPLDGRILPGVTRAAVLGVLDELGIEHEQHPVPLEEVRRADEMFVSNAVVGVCPVTSCEGVGSWPVGPVTRAVAEALGR